MLLSQDPNGCLEMLLVLYFNLQITNSSVTDYFVSLCLIYTFLDLELFLIVICWTLCFVPVSFNLNKHLECDEDHDVTHSEIPPLQHPLN